MLCAVISSSSLWSSGYQRVGRKMAFTGCKVSGSIMGALYSYCTSVEVGSTLEGGLAQQSSLVPIA